MPEFDTINEAIDAWQRGEISRAEMESAIDVWESPERDFGREGDPGSESVETDDDGSATVGLNTDRAAQYALGAAAVVGIVVMRGD